MYSTKGYIIKLVAMAKRLKVGQKGKNIKSYYIKAFRRRSIKNSVSHVCTNHHEKYIIALSHLKG